MLSVAIPVIYFSYLDVGVLGPERIRNYSIFYHLNVEDVRHVSTSSRPYSCACIY